jgi:SMODS-associating 4TM effector domain
MNTIPQDQNTPGRLKLLAAQRQLYSEAKKLNALSIIISVPFAVVCSILVAILPGWTTSAALCGILVTLIDLLYLSQQQKSLQEKAAKIQQRFDCDVLQLNWSNFNCENEIEPETINDASNRYIAKNKNYSALEDWYSVNVDKLPIYQARIVCQRANVQWESQLRRRYSNGIATVLTLLAVIVSLIGLIGGWTIEKLLLAVIVPLLPAFLIGLRQYRENRDAAIKVERLRENAEALIRETIDKRLTQQELERKSYDLQAQIYDNRRRNLLIFDWIYSLPKNKDEESMNQSAEYWVEQLTKTP